MFELSIAAKNEELDEYTGKMIASGCSLAVFRSIAFQDPVILQSELVDPLINSQHPKAVDWVNALTNHILDDHESQGRVIVSCVGSKADEHRFLLFRTSHSTTNGRQRIFRSNMQTEAYHSLPVSRAG